MKTVAILSNKGGAGKTTLAINLAVAASKAGQSTVLIDLDPQSSALDWDQSREQDTPIVARTTAKQLPGLIEALKEDGNTDLIFIDTAPRTETDATEAARVADFALIPCRASVADLRAIKHTLSITQYEKVPAAVVLNAVPARGKLREESLAALEVYNQSAAPGSIGNRISFVHAFTEGLSVLEWEPKGKAAGEIRALYRYIFKQLGGV